MAISSAALRGRGDVAIGLSHTGTTVDTIDARPPPPPPEVAHPVGTLPAKTGQPLSAPTRVGRAPLTARRSANELASRPPQLAAR
jgi:hypothetical protein